MMSSLFSSFDVYLMSFLMLPSHLPLIAYVSLFFNHLWLSVSPSLLMTYLLSMISMNLVLSSKMKSLSGSVSLVSGLFISLLILNFGGAIPLIPSLTALLMTTISVGSPMWLAMMFANFLIKIKTLKSHQLPEGSPTLISNLLSSIELTSQMIRPITLSFRLTANISAGHLILGMISMMLAFMFLSNLNTLLLLVLMVGVGYFSFEGLILFVQALVFSLLSSMYSSDHLT